MLSSDSLADTICTLNVFFEQTIGIKITDDNEVAFRLDDFVMGQWTNYVTLGEVELKRVLHSDGKIKNFYTKTVDTLIVLA